MVPVPASHPGYYPGTPPCSLVTMQFIACGPGCAAAFLNELQRLTTEQGTRIKDMKWYDQLIVAE